MQENVLTYREVLEYFSEETIRDRYRFLYDRLQEYIKERQLNNKLRVDEPILQQMVMDYFADIHRLKEFHKIEHVNKAKIVAYEVYWLLRRKPLQIIGFDQSKDISFDQINQNLVFCNEGFAVTLIANELLMPKASIPLKQEKEEDFMLFLDHLYYHLKYRNVDKQCLELMLYAFDVGKQCL